MFNLKDKIALVTGAATGLGQAIAVSLAQSGADVIITDKENVCLDETQEKMGEHRKRGCSFVMDITIASHREAVFKKTKKEFGRLDILINNAGINKPIPGLDVTEDNWDDHYNVNVKGGFFVAQQAAKMMIPQNWGRIIFISSQSGLIGIPGQPVYCSTKGAIIQLVRTLGVEWAKYGITVNSIAPTFVETNLTRKRLQQPDFLKFVLGKIPLGKLAEPKDIAAAAVYLASEEAAMVNATTLSVDGGWTAW